MHKAKIVDVNVTAEHRIGHPLYIPAAVTQSNSKQIYTRTQNNSNRVSDRNTILYALCTPLSICTNTNRLATPNLSRPFADSPMESSKNLLSLNDDCLLIILGQLDLNTLSNIAQTCLHLKSLACSSFRRRFKHLIAEQWLIVDTKRIVIKKDYYGQLFAFSEMAKSIKVYGDDYPLLAYFPSLEELALLFNVYDDFVTEKYAREYALKRCPTVKTLHVTRRYVYCIDRTTTYRLP